MGWNYRRRIKVAPGVRLNISKSGISSTVGVRGASITHGRKGTYINTGVPGTGFYRREKISNDRERTENTPISIDNSKSKTHVDGSGFLLFLLFGLPLIIMPILYFLNHRSTVFWFLTILYSIVYIGIVVLWIRKQFMPKFDEVLEEAEKSLQNYNGTEKKILQNFINCYKLSDKIDTLEKIVEELKCKTEKNNSKKLKRITHEKELELEKLVDELKQVQYDVDAGLTIEEKRAYGALCSSFEKLMCSDKIWKITSVVETNQVKSWAVNSVARKNASLYLGVFNFLRSEFDIPVFDLGDIKYYLYPKFVIRVNTVFDFEVYPHRIAIIEAKSVAFSEESDIPQDSRVLYHTWQYVNKDGGPDKRFSNNTQLPVCKYSMVSISVAGNVEKIMFSNYELAEDFATQYNAYIKNQVLDNYSNFDEEISSFISPSFQRPLSDSWDMIEDETNVPNVATFSISVDLFNHLKMLNNLESVNSILHFYESKLSVADSFTFTIQNQLAFLALHDLSNCCKKIEYDIEKDIKTGGVFTTFIMLLTNRDFNNDLDLLNKVNLELIDSALQFWMSYNNSFAINYSSKKLLLVEILRQGCIEESLIDRYVVLFYRLMSYLIKIDGTVTLEESTLLSSIMDSLTENKNDFTMYYPDNSDPLLYKAAKIIIDNKRAATSLLQQHLGIGYNRATNLMNELELKGVVGRAAGQFSQRTVLVDDISQISFLEHSVGVFEVVEKEDEKLPNSTVTAQLSNKGMALERLNELIGLEEVKEEVVSLTNYVKIQQLRKKKGLGVKPLSLHCVFTGNPGTGKTIVARILAEVYRDLGVLPKGHLVETDRSGLVAEYVGQTAVKTNKIIDSALDGVLFIDEAYSLVQGGNKDYGNEAVSTLLKRMEDDRDRLVVILAGYEEEMKIFLESNPGLYSRFNKYLNFPDYTAHELIRMFKYYVTKYDYVLNESAEECLLDLFNTSVGNKDKRFGNARYVRNVFEKTLQLQATRLASIPKITKEVLKIITAEDIPTEK